MLVMRSFSSIEIPNRGLLEGFMYVFCQCSLRLRFCILDVMTNLKVFPGGNYDEKQDESLTMTAIRETFEESGLLVASFSNSNIPDDVVLDEARQRIHSQKLLFQTFLAEHQMRADVSSLLPFTQWITPKAVPRFNSYFTYAMSDSLNIIHYTQTLPHTIFHCLSPCDTFSGIFVRR